MSSSGKEEGGSKELTACDLRQRACDYDLLHVRTIDLTRGMFHDLAAVIVCKELVEVNVSDNHMVDLLPMAKLPMLRVLRADNNVIRSLVSLEGHMTLEHVSVRGNLIRDGDGMVRSCQKLPCLVRLDFDYLDDRRSNPVCGEDSVSLRRIREQLPNLQICNGFVASRVPACLIGVGKYLKYEFFLEKLPSADLPDAGIIAKPTPWQPPTTTILSGNDDDLAEEKQLVEAVESQFSIVRLSLQKMKP